MAHKVAKKSTNIDMTAMCDVAFLLLTFFILVAKARPDEPVIVRTPTSVSELALPDSSIILTVDKGGRIFFDYNFQKAKEDIIKQVNDEKQLGLNAKEMEMFAIGSSFGAPIARTKEFLNLTKETRSTYPNLGIPCDSAGLPETNELAYWIFKARTVGQSYGKPPRICIKSDGGLKYPGFQNLLKTLTKNEINSFNLLTGVEAVPGGTALADANAALNAKKQ
jgi:biopolymer transport protein ExbD